jgi:predicted GIY-YIG superfamily endonuclease
MDKRQVIYVYELTDQNGKVVYVGESVRPQTRLYEHTRRQPRHRSGYGRFYGRTDLTLEVVAQFDNRKDSFNHQCSLQVQYGLDTDTYSMRKNSVQNGLSNSKVSLDQVDEIRSKRKEGYKIVKLAEEYNISRFSIYKIINYISYKK